LNLKSNQNEPGIDTYIPQAVSQRLAQLTPTLALGGISAGRTGADSACRRFPSMAAKAFLYADLKYNDTYHIALGTQYDLLHSGW